MKLKSSAVVLKSTLSMSDPIRRLQYVPITYTVERPQFSTWRALGYSPINTQLILPRW